MGIRPGPTLVVNLMSRQVPPISWLEAGPSPWSPVKMKSGAVQAQGPAPVIPTRSAASADRIHLQVVQRQRVLLHVSDETGLPPRLGRVVGGEPDQPRDLPAGLVEVGVERHGQIGPLARGNDVA